MIWASVNLDFLITLPRRCGSLYFQTVYLEGELTGAPDRRLGQLAASLQLAPFSQRDRPTRAEVQTELVTT